MLKPINLTPFRALLLVIAVCFGFTAYAADSSKPAPEMLNAVAEELININTADIELLQSLPQIGPAKAQAIVDWREANGPFTSFEQLLAVRGIGPKILALNQPLIRL